MKHVFTAAIAGVGLLVGLNVATACEHKMNNAAAESRLKLAADTNAPKDATPHPKSKTEAQGVKNTTKAPANSAGSSETQQPAKKPNS